MDVTAATDHELAAAAAAGDEAAFAAIHARYASVIHDYCARMTRSRDDAADLTQITFERAWHNLSTRQAGRSLKSWLYAIAHHASIDLLRRRRPAVPVEDGDSGAFAAVGDAGDPERAVIADETARDVWDAATALSRSEYTALHYQLRAGMTPDEIGAAMSISSGAVHTTLSRARDALEEAFTVLQLVRRGRRDCAGLAGALGARPPHLALDKATRRVVRRHLSECDVCTANSERFVAAAVFSALVPVAPVAALRLPPLGPQVPDRRRRAKRRRAPRRRLVAAGAGVLATAVIAGALVAARDAGPGPDRTPPRDPTRIESSTHRVGEPSTNRVVVVRWSGASDPAGRDERASRVAGYSTSWTPAPAMPDRVQEVGAAVTTSSSPELVDGSWWFNISTVDAAGNWTSTGHLGPFVIVSPPPPSTTTTQTGRESPLPPHSPGRQPQPGWPAR